MKERYKIEGCMRELNQQPKGSERKLLGARLLSGREEELHQDVAKKINELLANNSNFSRLKRRAYSNPLHLELYGGLAGLVQANGQTHVIVDESIADATRKAGLLKAALAHEYGHILHNEQIDQHIRMHLTYAKMHDWLSSPIYVGEGFAYWFGDAISGFKSPISQLAQQYGPKNPPEKIIKIYQELMQHSRENGVAETLREAPNILAKWQ